MDMERGNRLGFEGGKAGKPGAWQLFRIFRDTVTFHSKQRRKKKEKQFICRKEEKMQIKRENSKHRNLFYVLNEKLLPETKMSTQDQQQVCKL